MRCDYCGKIAECTHETEYGERACNECLSQFEIRSDLSVTSES